MDMYKEAKTLDQQIEHLHNDKRINFNDIDIETAKKILFRYNYINVITPYKHHFAKKNEKKELIKVNGNHVYDNDVDFKEYYEKYKMEREKYPLIIKNIIGFETIFKSIISYRILTYYDITDSEKLENFLDVVDLGVTMNSKFSEDRLKHMRDHIKSLKESIDKHHDIYCYFDRLSLGNLLTIFCGINRNLQNDIFYDFKKINMHFGVDKVPDFITKVFTLVSIRNCVMHCNSLEILIRFYNPKTKELRKSNNRKRFTSLINSLSKEKDYTNMV